ncbi:hypothetical protein KJ940_19805 [Myxococcota bacterium]|nr:hypothetical protein [Myxococcota bacterium]
MPDPQEITAFIDRWRDAGGSERANHQLFFSELCALLEVAPPNPATRDEAQDAYVFERRVIFHNADGSTGDGFIDCYRRGCFVLEAKSTQDKTIHEQGLLSAPLKRVAEILETLTALGQARKTEDGQYAAV